MTGGFLHIEYGFVTNAGWRAPRSVEERRTHTEKAARELNTDRTDRGDRISTTTTYVYTLPYIVYLLIYINTTYI